MSFLINHRLIIEAHQIIINYISSDIPFNFFTNTEETKKYFKNVYDDLYKYNINIKKTVKILKWYYGETDNYKKLEREIKVLYNARNEINHSSNKMIKGYSTFEETKFRLKKIEELIKSTIYN